MVGFSDKFLVDMSVSEVMSNPLITINPDTLVKDAVSTEDYSRTHHTQNQEVWNNGY
jgi:predicted transcriptional regulator